MEQPELVMKFVTVLGAPLTVGGRSVGTFSFEDRFGNQAKSAVEVGLLEDCWTPPPRSTPGGPITSPFSAKSTTQAILRDGAS